MHKYRDLFVALNRLLAAALFGMFFFTGDLAISDPRQPSPSEGEVSKSNCDPDNVVVYQADEVREANAACASDAEIAIEDRDYLVDTSTPGGTMMRQGPEVAIGRLHPEFIRRLAAAIREARQMGLPSAGIFSAYRPPAFGVGGFSDKFNSLHTYGLAVDMSGIGAPGSAEAKLWYEIAARHGVTCPYGFENRVEWNHCQPTRIRIVLPESPLRDTVTASGPIDLDSMFEAGNALIESPENVVGAANPGAADPVASAPGYKADNRAGEQPTAAENAIGAVRRRFGNTNLTRMARAKPSSEPANWCKHLHHPSKACGNSHQVETAGQGSHPRQASALAPRHHT